MRVSHSGTPNLNITLNFKIFLTASTSESCRQATSKICTFQVFPVRALPRILQGRFQYDRAIIVVQLQGLTLCGSATAGRQI